MSAFMSNNGTVAIWMPIIAIVAANSCGKIRSKMVIFPAGTAAIIGGACSLIGSTSQLAANSVLQGYAGYEEGMKLVKALSGQIDKVEKQILILSEGDDVSDRGNI